MRKSKRRQSSGLLFFQLLFVITLCLFGLVVFVILSESEKQLVTDEQIETLAAITKGNGKEIDEKVCKIILLNLFLGYSKDSNSGYTT